MWSTPTKINDSILDFGRRLQCDWIGAVLVECEPAYDYDNCHNNADVHSTLYGGKPIVGWYIIDGGVTLQAIRHTVWNNNNNEFIDITPYKDNRDFIIFAKSRIQNKDYSIPNCYNQSIDKYFSINIEEQKNLYYYVYELVDPRDNQPFYVGKDKGKRVTSQLLEKFHGDGVNKKIQDIRKNNQFPKVRLIAENIIDEKLAYDIETTTTVHYFQKGYNLENKNTKRGSYARGKNNE